MEILLALMTINIKRIYILLDNEKVIGFQTAQLRKNESIIEGWRNFAYIKPEYAGKTGKVLTTFKKSKMDF